LVAGGGGVVFVFPRIKRLVEGQNGDVSPPKFLPPLRGLGIAEGKGTQGLTPWASVFRAFRSWASGLQRYEWPENWFRGHWSALKVLKFFADGLRVHRQEWPVPQGWDQVNQSRTL